MWFLPPTEFRLRSYNLPDSRGKLYGAQGEILISPIITAIYLFQADPYSTSQIRFELSDIESQECVVLPSTKPPVDLQGCTSSKAESQCSKEAHPPRRGTVYESAFRSPVDSRRFQPGLGRTRGEITISSCGQRERGSLDRPPLAIQVSSSFPFFRRDTTARREVQKSVVQPLFDLQRRSVGGLPATGS